MRNDSSHDRPFASSVRTVRGSYEAGLLVRGQIKREITAACWRYDCDVTFEEIKGLLASEIRYTITGTRAEQVNRASGVWLDEISF